MSQILHSTSNNQPHDQLIKLISSWIAPLGFQVIYLELQSHRQKTLRIFIDRLESLSTEETENKDAHTEAHKANQAHDQNAPTHSIGIEDCVQVSRFLDEKLDQSPEIQTLLPGAYELEVSSPGVDRPLRTVQDFQRFIGYLVRIHLFRPLTSDEIENAAYQKKQPKQKNFLGTLIRLEGDKVILSMDQTTPSAGSQRKPSKAKKKIAELPTNSVEEGNRVAIPLPLISKANLEPQFDFGESNERES